MNKNVITFYYQYVDFLHRTILMLIFLSGTIICWTHLYGIMYSLTTVMNIRCIMYIFIYTVSDCLPVCLCLCICVFVCFYVPVCVVVYVYKAPTFSLLGNIVVMLLAIN